MTKTKKKALAPDLDQITDHLTFHFGSMLSGKMEMAGIHPDPSINVKGQQFPLTEIEDAAAWVFKMNTDGYNTYFGVATRIEGIAPFGRAKEFECMATKYLWADTDDEGAAEAAQQILLDAGILPSYTVKTGSYPYNRVQYFFELDEPVPTIEEGNELNKAMAYRLGADKAVWNNGRIMRVGGSVAWAKKDGRKDEMTSFKKQATEEHTIPSVKKTLKLPEALQQAAEAVLAGTDTPDNVIRLSDGILGGPETIMDGREKYMADCVYAAMIEAIGTAGEITSVTWRTIHNLSWPIFSAKADMVRPGHNTEAEVMKKCQRIIPRLNRGELKEFPNGDVASVVAAWEAKVAARAATAPATPEAVIQKADEIAQDNSPDALFPIEYDGTMGGVVQIDQLVHGMIVEAALSVVYGDSNVGKSFWAMDLGYHIAMGEPWNGCRVKQKGVVLVAMEGGRSTRNRMIAFRKHHPFTGAAHFALIPSTVNLFDSEQDPAKLVASIQAAGEKMGVPIGLVIIDTLARAMAGGNENTTEDMGRLIANADAIRAATGAHVMLIHHTGKDKSRGARGSSALRAATDTEIELSKLEGSDIAAVNVTKQRDLDGNQHFNFQLKVIEIGVDEDGEPITSCVIDMIDDKQHKAKPKLTTAERLGWDKVAEFFESNAEIRTVMTGMTPQKSCYIDHVRNSLRNRGITDKDKPENERVQWKRIKDGLISKGYIEINRDLMWLVRDKDDKA